MAPLSMLLLLSLLAIPSSATVTFSFRGNITCSLGFPFNYQLQVIEEDLIKDDKISRASFVYSETSPSAFQITASDTHDGPTDYYFDIAFHVYHDCSIDRTHLKARFRVGQFLAYPGSHYVDELDMDITNKGDRSDW